MKSSRKLDAFWWIGLTLCLLWIAPAFAKSLKNLDAIGEVKFGNDAIFDAQQMKQEWKKYQRPNATNLSISSVRDAKIPPRGPSVVAPQPSPDGYYDELNSAREQARKMLEVSQRESAQTKLSPVTLPSRPGEISPTLSNELAQVTSAYSASVASFPDDSERLPNVLRPLRAPTSVAPASDLFSATPASPDEGLEMEIKDYEERLAGRPTKFVEPKRTSQKPVKEEVAFVKVASENDIPMLIPKYTMRGRKLPRPQAEPKSYGRYTDDYLPLATNTSARGSTRPQFQRSVSNPEFKPALARSVENEYEQRKKVHYVHLPDVNTTKKQVYQALFNQPGGATQQTIEPSRGRGANVRIHDIGDPQ